MKVSKKNSGNLIKTIMSQSNIKVKSTVKEEKLKKINQSLQKGQPIVKAEPQKQKGFQRTENYAKMMKRMNQELFDDDRKATPQTQANLQKV